MFLDKGEFLDKGDQILQNQMFLDKGEFLDKGDQILQNQMFLDKGDQTSQALLNKDHDKDKDQMPQDIDQNKKIDQNKDIDYINNSYFKYSSDISNILTTPLLNETTSSI